RGQPHGLVEQDRYRVGRAARRGDEIWVAIPVDVAGDDRPPAPAEQLVREEAAARPTRQDGDKAAVGPERHVRIAVEVQVADGDLAEGKAACGIHGGRSEAAARTAEENRDVPP